MGGKIAVTPSEEFNRRMSGASEKDIVHSGLDYSMERTAHSVSKQDYYLTFEVTYANISIDYDHSYGDESRPRLAYSSLH